MMERLAMVGLFLSGGRAGYISGDITKMLGKLNIRFFSHLQHLYHFTI
jgi:hypothetical protein